ncbi:relaxase/mobilization nuclease domain-containing protein [Lachnospiraceae bacterium 50-23]
MRHKNIIVSIPEGRYENQDAVEKVISYIMRLNKGNLMGGYGILITTHSNITEQFLRVKEAYGKTGGKQILHIVFSVERTLGLTPDQIKKLGYMLAAYFGKERQVIFAVHDDTGHLHIHMGINTVAYTNGSYCAYFELGDLKNYAEQCIDKLVDMVWFGKDINREIRFWA